VSIVLCSEHVSMGARMRIAVPLDVFLSDKPGQGSLLGGITLYSFTVSQVMPREKVCGPAIHPFSRANTKLVAKTPSARAKRIDGFSRHGGYSFLKWSLKQIERLSVDCCSMPIDVELMKIMGSEGQVARTRRGVGTVTLATASAIQFLRLKPSTAKSRLPYA
jgi:hypothetical protein